MPRSRKLAGFTLIEVMAAIALSGLSIFGFFLFKQKTAYEISLRDWSSDVCSSDLARLPLEARLAHAQRRFRRDERQDAEIGRASCGKECERLCRSRWSPYY